MGIDIVKEVPQGPADFIGIISIYNTGGGRAWESGSGTELVGIGGWSVLSHRGIAGHVTDPKTRNIIAPHVA